MNSKKQQRHAATTERRILGLQSTVLMSLLQPQREVYNEADDIMLLAEGAPLCVTPTVPGNQSMHCDWVGYMMLEDC